MSFSNRMLRVKLPIGHWRIITVRSKLHFYGKIWKVAQDRFVAVDGGLGRFELRSGHWRGCGQSIRHLRDANVAGEARHVKPVRNRKISERHKNDACDHDS